MGPVIALLVIAAVAFFIIRLGATTLERTGLSRDAARFQALSAFFGAGFTTGESELVVNHPVRRRVIRDLIIVGNIGILSALASGILTATSHPVEGNQRYLILAGGLVALWLLARSRLLQRLIDKSISYTLEHTHGVHALDYEKLLRTHAGFSVSEVLVEPKSPVCGKTLGEARLRAHGVTVLGVARSDGAYDGRPRGHTTVNRGDTLLVYGPDAVIEALAENRLEVGPPREQEQDRGAD